VAAALFLMAAADLFFATLLLISFSFSRIFCPLSKSAAMNLSPLMSNIFVFFALPLATGISIVAVRAVLDTPGEVPAGGITPRSSSSSCVVFI